MVVTDKLTIVPQSVSVIGAIGGAEGGRGGRGGGSWKWKRDWGFLGLTVNADSPCRTRIVRSLLSVVTMFIWVVVLI